jgi:hypothetical protein
MRSNFRLWAAISVILGMLAADALDSFGLSSAADARGARVTERLLAPFYDAGTSQARDLISVVLISDATLEALETGPPPPYALQADLIFRLAEARPAAIFFDFVYVHPRETPDALAYLGAAIDHAASLGVPVITGPRADKPAFDPLAQAQRADLGWRSERESDYPMVGGSGLPTAAAALYGTACAAHPERGCSSRLLDPAVRATLPDLSVQWGGGAAKGLATFWTAEEAARCEGEGGDRLVQMLMTAAREAARGALGPASDRFVGCLYHLSAPAHVLLQQDQATIDAFAKGRVVLIGSAYEGSADIVTAPGYGRIPGVMQHAMALDNLLVFHDAYRRWPAPVVWQLDLDDLLEGLMCIALLALGALTLNRVVARADALDGMLAEAGRLPETVPAGAWASHVVGPAAWLYAFLGLVLLAPLASAAAASFVLDWPPANVLGVAGTVIATGAILARRDQIARLLQPEILNAVGAGALASGVCVAILVGGVLYVGVTGSIAVALGLVLGGVAASILVGAGVVALMRPKGRATTSDGAG